MSKIPIDNNIFLVCWIVLWLVLFYSIYYQFRKTSITERAFTFRLSIYCLIFLGITYLFLEKIIEVFIMTANRYVIGLMWTLMVSLILYMFFNICGFGKFKSDNSTQYILIIFLIYMSINGFGYFGLRIVIHSKWLNYETFQTNSYKGIKFIAHNLWYLILIYFISYLTEREV